MAAEVGSAYFTLLPSVKGLQGAIGREVAGVNGAAAGANIGKSMGGGIAGSLRAVVGPAIAAIGIGKAFSFAKDAVNSFSELEDSSAAAGVIFGKNMGSIIEQSKTAGSKLGLSEQQVISAANTFGTYGKAAGLSGKKLADFSTQQTALAADMASFKGTSPEQAIEAIGSALRGEMEPIRAYGVLLDDASLRQQAMKMGLISTTKDALSPQNKTLAAQALILAQTKDAQGDFARTSQSTANIAKTLASETENVSAKFGQVLAPAFTSVRKAALVGVRGVSGFLDSVLAMKKGLADGKTNVDIGKAIGLSGGGLKIFSEGLGSVRAFFGALRDGGEVTSSGLAGKFEAAGIKINSVFGKIRDLFHNIVAGFRMPDFQMPAGLEGPLVSAFKAGQQLREVFRTLGDTLGPVFGTLAGTFGTLFASLGPLIPQFLSLWTAISPLGIVLQALAPIIPIIAEQLGSLAIQVGGILMSAISAVMPVLTQLAQVLTQALGQIFISLAPVIVTLLGQMGVMFAQLAPVVTQIITVVAQLVMQLVSALMPIFMQLVAAVFPMVIQIFGAVMAAIVPLVSMIAGLLIPIIRALLPVVVVVFSVVASVIRSAMQIVMGIIQVVTGIISGNWSQVWNGIVNILRGVWSLITGVISGALGIVRSVISAGIGLAVGFIRNGFQGAVGFLAGVWNNIVNGVSGMIGRVSGFFGGLGGKILGALGNIGSTLYNAGRDIVQGLINGIGSMLGSIGRAVLDIVPAAIRGPFEKLMGIQSPSRVAIWWGEMIGGGLAGSIRKQTPKVASAVRKLVPGLPAGVEAFARAGARTAYDVARGDYSGHGAGITQNVYPAEGMSETNLADLVGRKLIRAGA